ncbi:WD repeat-containing protein 11-like isoform X2 [Mizuhopecten yessoensis]|uniref:WD repeat-containing protein 11 n=1 Tax=Mizuhopecten yessoensis TaxID=6573 RepID=A0A210QSI0_MIZYE|nr:WD repeat-containing protein 11-like isoform X2 [Mizuhopecten yessoensis]OWF51700.1 WD repeat-containing protein 11 [Mizuhopecten yessoensis]
MKLAPKIVTGALHSQNKGACDWGWQGLLAYGCHSFVVIVDPKNVQVIQVLYKHKSNVVKVKWARENYNHDQGSPYNLRLASADASGVIVTWDVIPGQSKAEFSDGQRPIQDLEWLSNQDASHDLLVALHPPYSLILWNADTGTKLWKKSYTEPLLSFSFDPFNIKNVAFLGQDCIVFVDDFSITKTPSSNGKKFYISSPSSQASNLKTEGSTSSLDKKSTSRNLAKRMSKMLVGEGPSKKSGGDEESVTLNECLQLEFHRACRHHLILVYPREILLLDLEINQTVGIITMERTGSPFVQVLPLRQRDVMLCLHENGSITTRVRRRTNVITTPASEGVGAFDDSPPHVSMDVAYDMRCQSDSLRVTRHSKVVGIACCPVFERSVVLIMTDSRVIFWEMLMMEPVVGVGRRSHSPLHTPGSSIPEDISKLSSIEKLPVITGVTPPKLSLCDMIGQSQVMTPDNQAINRGKGVALKFVMTGLMSGVSTPITVIKMCPPLTTKNWSVYQPLLAMGSNNGTIQILHVSSGQIEREYSVHAGPVRGIEWSSLKSFISYSYPNPGQSGLVKNELFLVDVSSGKITTLRGNHDQEPPIDILRISYLKQYFVICFKEKPLELWDLRSLTMLREMGKSIPRPTALEWSPSHTLKILKRKLLTQDLADSEQESGGIFSSKSSDVMSTSKSSSTQEISDNTDPIGVQKVTLKEHFVFTDGEGNVYHFVVEGTSFIDATKIPAESGLGSISCIAWKGECITFGDGDGQLCIWDLKGRTSRTLPTHRGWIKKIRFAPGRGNIKFLIMYNDGVDIWDMKGSKPELTGSAKSPREIAKLADAEWCGSDRVALATTNGCVYVTDLTLKNLSSPVEDWDLPGQIWCPYMLSNKGSLLLKYVLQHQPWNTDFSLQLEGMMEDDVDVQTAINKHLNLLDSGVTEYIGNCRFGTAERCLLVARLFGDESDLLFWTVALHYLKLEKLQPAMRGLNGGREQGRDRYVPATKEANDLVVLDNPEEVAQRHLVEQLFQDPPLERYFDTICSNTSFQKYQLDRVALHDSKRATYDHTKKCAENYGMLGQTDRAVQLLLETEPDSDQYYTDCLRACLVASIRSSGASQSTIKLVATNLIANGKLTEGVQLLCLIDKGMDACRYLQTYGAWDQAVWLAKATLGYTDCCEVLKRWVDHLCSTQVNQKSKALLVMLSLGHFPKVLEMLYGMRQFNRAACFAEACMEFGLLDMTPDTKSLVEAIFLEYARQLINLGHRKASEHYCRHAGDKGTQLMKEVDILFS